jgi:ribonuclease HI
MKLFFDGGASPNPGTGECAVVSVDGSIKIHQKIPGDKTTNNEAEWLGFLLAVEYAKPYASGPVEIVGDSKLVIMQASKEWKISEKFIPYYNDFNLNKNLFVNLNLTHVKRHLNLAGIYIEELQNKR